MQKIKVSKLIKPILLISGGFTISLKYTWQALDSYQYMLYFTLEYQRAIMNCVPLFLATIIIGFVANKRGWLLGLIVAFSQVMFYFYFSLVAASSSPFGNRFSELPAQVPLELLILSIAITGGLIGELVKVMKKRPFVKILNWITKKGTIKLAILIFLISSIFAIGLEVVIIMIQFKLQSVVNAPLQDNHFVLSKAFQYYSVYCYSIGKIKSIIYNIISILLGSFLIHLAFPVKKRLKRYIHLLNSTLFLSAIGIPFLFIRISQSIVTREAYNLFYKPYSVIIITIANSGIISSLLFWMIAFFGYFQGSPAGLINIAFYVVVCYIYVLMISKIYNVSFANGLARFLIATLLLGLIWLFLYSFLPPYTFGAHGTRLRILLVRLDSFLLR